jgi:hypothetical protein
MRDSSTWWSFQFSLNSLEFVMIYFLSHALIKKYVKAKVQHVILCLCYTIAMSPVFFFEGDFIRVIGSLFMLLIIKAIIKRSDVGNLLIIYVLLLIVPPLFLIIWLVKILINFYLPIMFLIG